MDKILPVYEQTKQVMGFDPEAQVQLPEIAAPRGGFWSDLHDKYPMPLRERIRGMATDLGWTQEQLEQEWAWMSWLFEQERSANVNEQAQQAAAPAGHPGPTPDLGVAANGNRFSGTPGTPGSDEGDQGGEAEQVPG